MPRIGNYKAPVDEKLIGTRLRDIRRRRGVTQVELAKVAGIDQALVSEYERGTVRLHGAIVAAFAKALSVSADELLGIKDIKGTPSVEDRRVLRRMKRIEKLPERAKVALLRTIDTYVDGAEARRRSA